MQLANIKVGGPKKSHFLGKPKRTGSSLKNIKSVRVQIQKQERIKKKLQKASESGKDAKRSLEVELEIKKAFEKLRGIKVHDDLHLLKKAEKRLVRKKKKSAERWSAKQEEVKKSQEERQTKRKENIEQFRKGKKKSVRAEADAPEGAKKGPGMSRKQRRHANLLKYGDKKTRAEREEKRKQFRKEQKANRKSSPGGKRQMPSKPIKKRR